MDLHDQSSKYFTLESINSNLQKTVDNTNVRLDDKTSALWTEISNVTEEVVSISGMTNRSFDILRNKNVLLENKFQEISNNQSNIVSTLNQISKYYKVKYYKVVFLLSQNPNFLDLNATSKVYFFCYYWHMQKLSSAYAFFYSYD